MEKGAWRRGTCCKILAVTLECVERLSITVRCSHPAYNTYFRMHEKEVLMRLHEKLPGYEIRKVKVLN